LTVDVDVDNQHRQICIWTLTTPVSWNDEIVVVVCIAPCTTSDRKDVQMLTHAMSLFFPPRGLAGGEVELLGTCSCGGLIQVATDATRNPPRRQVCCSSSQVGACHAGLGKRAIVNPLRSLDVRLFACSTACENCKLFPILPALSYNKKWHTMVCNVTVETQEDALLHAFELFHGGE
jgi:hypothetical protein